MIFISMQGADGSRSAFVNNNHTEFAKLRKNAVKRLENPRLMEGYLQASVSILLSFSYKIKYMTTFGLDCD